MKSWYDFMGPPFQPPWDNLRGKFTTAALCDSGRIWLKNWGQMAVRCRHGEWVAVKWQRGQFTLLLCFCASFQHQTLLRLYIWYTYSKPWEHCFRGDIQWVEYQGLCDRKAKKPLYIDNCRNLEDWTECWRINHFIICSHWRIWPDKS